jgi:predicted oxidoreductase
MEPEEVASAFEILYEQGAVRSFGVSNQSPGQIDLLKTAVRQPLIVNQLQLSLGHTRMIDQGFNVNMANPAGTMRDGGVLEYCRRHQITIQAWSPLQFGFFEGVFIDHPSYGPLSGVLRRIADEQGVSSSAVAIAWILRHPAGIQPILGSMNPSRIREMAKAPEVQLSRQQWYELYRAAGNNLP